MEDQKIISIPSYKKLSLEDLSKDNLQNQLEQKSSNSLIDKIKLNIQKEESSLNNVVKNEQNTHQYLCKDHADRLLQFYSLAEKKCLCSECLLTRRLEKDKILNLKQVKENVKQIIELSLLKIADESEKLTKYQEVLLIKKDDLNISISNKKDQVKLSFQVLHDILVTKEKEFLKKIEDFKKEIDIKFESATITMKNTLEQIDNIKSTLRIKFNEADFIKNIGACQYYFTEIENIKKLVDDKTKFQCIIEGISINDDYEFTSYFDVANKILSSSNNHEVKVEDNQIISIEEKAMTQGSKDKRTNIYNKISLLETRKNHDQKGESAVFKKDNNTSLFFELKDYLEDISPLPIAKREASSPGGMEDSFIKFFDKMEETKKLPDTLKVDISEAGVQSTPKILKFESLEPIVLKLNKIKDFEVENKSTNSLNNHKDLENEQHDKFEPNLLKHHLENDIKKSKPTPKSYLQNFIQPRTTKFAENCTIPLHKEPFNNIGLMQKTLATKGLTDLIKMKASKNTNIDWKLKFRRNDDSLFSLNLNKSSGSRSLTTNLKNLKKEIGL